MNKLSRSRVCLAAMSLLLTAVQSSAQQKKPCEQARFADDAGSAYQAVTESAGKEAADVVVYCEEEHYVLDSEGREVRTSYLLYKVLTQKGAEAWDDIEREWEPWHQAKPQLRARVLSEAKPAQWLDQKTVSDGAATETEDKIYSDRRVVRAPLPALAPGVVVEQEILQRGTAPFFAAGIARETVLVRSGPVRESRVIVEAPNTMPLKYVTKLLPKVQVQKTEANQTIRLEFDQDALESYDDTLELRPADVPAYPTVAFATGKSWQEIARAYSAIVDRQGNANEVKALVAGLTKGKSSRKEKIEAVVQYLGKEIRYTGIEFDEATIVPHTPGETLKRKYGDCKDKATLLVAMLRAAEIPASVALLNVSGWTDTDEELPGLGLFDHAIVEVPGSPEYWIDATDEFARLGQLPASDQGRLALIAAENTEKLKRIPESSSEENRTVEKREIRLADYGPARVTEITEPHGVFEAEYRSWYVDEINKDVRKKLADYMKNEYVAEKLGKVQKTDAKDLSKGFTLTLEAEKAKRGYTELDSAAVAIRLDGLFRNLPDSLREKEEKRERKDDGSEAKPKKERTTDYQLREAFISEWEYTIVPPDGFQMKALPESKKVEMGPARLDLKFQTRADGAVEAKIHFDIAKRRFTVKEAKELRDRVVEMSDAESLVVRFEPTATALMNRGQARESFAAWRGMIAKHPADAVRHLQYAKALLGAGLGEAARAEAKTAVKLEPSSALAEKTLAEILQCDLVGRKFKSGSDYRGAEAAFRAAEKLDPDDTTIPGNLGILLEYNPEGERYGLGAKLKEAVAEYKSLKEEDLADIGLKSNLGFALFYAGQFAEAKAYAEKLNPAPNSLIVAAEAGANGAAAGITEAKKRVSREDDAKSVLVSAGDMLMKIRRYKDAADLLEAGANGNNASNTIALAGLLRKAKKHEDLKFEDSPAGFMREYFRKLCTSQMTLEWMKGTASRSARKTMERTDADELAEVEKAGRKIRQGMARQGIPADVMLDILVQSAEIHSEGDDVAGYRVTWPLGAGLKMFIVKEEGKYKLLDSATNPNSIGLEALERAKAGDLKGARTLLDWIREEQHVEGGDDALAGKAFPRMWSKGKDGGPEEIRRAAAAILCQTKQTAPEGIATLEPELSKAATETEKINISLALLEGYRAAQDLKKALDLSAELAKSYPDSKTLFLDQEFALRGLKQYLEADALANEYVKKNPGDLDGMRALVRSAEARLDYGLARERLEAVLQSGKAQASDYNTSAWYALFIGKIEAADVEAAVKGTQMSQHSAYTLHTLGCLYAEQGKTKEAREVLVQAMDQLSLEQPNDEYWYAFGRIAEEFGENQIAETEYKKLKKPKEESSLPASTYTLAQKRLRQMQEAQPPSRTTRAAS